MKLRKFTTALAFICVASSALAQGDAELAAKKHALCSDYGRLGEAIWRAKTTTKVADFNPNNGLHRRVADSILAKDGFIKLPRDAFDRGYSICEDAIEEGIRARMRR